MGQLTRAGWRLGAVAAVAMAAGCDGTLMVGGVSSAPCCGAGGTEPSGAAGGGDGQQPAGACQTAFDPGPSLIRRLTNREYERTVADLFGGPLPVASLLAPDVRFNAFDNNALTQELSVEHLRAYLAAAESVTAAVFASAQRRSAIAPCELATGGSTCLRQFVSALGQKMYRRPLSADELAGLEAVANAQPAGGDPYAKPAAALQTMLVSMSFLYRVEHGTPDPTRPGLARLSGYELASRLSYALLETTPDAELLAAAERGDLDSSEGLRAQVRRLLQGTTAREAFRHFSGQWLETPGLARQSRQVSTYPLWGDALKASMASEVERFIERLAFTDGASFMELIDTKVTYVDQQLAQLYGVQPAPPQGQWSQVTFGTDSPRSGVLTLASVLTVGSKELAASPMRRGKFVREALLCDPPPPPPSQAAIDGAPVKQPGMSEREWLALHRQDPACNGCHQLIDPVGFGLEGFGMIGEVRSVNEVGQPVDTHGTVVGFTPADFEGAAGLSQRLRENQGRVSQCVVKQLLRFQLGRDTTPNDACLVSTLDQQFAASGYRLPQLIEAIVVSDGFRYRRLADADPGAPPIATPSPTAPAAPGKLAVKALSASADDGEGNVGANAIDGDMSTRWAALGDGQSLTADLGAQKTISAVQIAWPYGAQRVDHYELAVSVDGVTFAHVFTGTASGTTVGLQRQTITPVAARFVKLVGHGNDQNEWNSVSELEVYGQ